MALEMKYKALDAKNARRNPRILKEIENMIKVNAASVAGIFYHGEIPWEVWDALNKAGYTMTNHDENKTWIYWGE